MTPEPVRTSTYMTWGDKPAYDPCASANPDFWLAKDNAFLPRNGLEEEWGPTNFINPPFGKSYLKDGICLSAQERREYLKTPGTSPQDHKLITTFDWAQKVTKEYEKGKEIIWLSKNSAEDKAIQHLLCYADGICFIKGRMGYLHPTTGIPKKGVSFGSIALFFGASVESVDRFVESFKPLGITLNIAEVGNDLTEK